MSILRRCQILILVALLLLVSCITGPFPPTPAGAQSTGRIGGDDRYHTAVCISQKGWDHSTTVFLARGDNYADALAGVPLAYRSGAPILLTRPGTLPEVTRDEIQRLEAEEIVILGGTVAVSAAVEQELKSLGLGVYRIGGENRFDTAALIAARFPTLGGAILVYGHNFPDALAAAAYAAREDYPILLTETDALPPETLAALDACSHVFVVGGERVISEKIFMQLWNDLNKNPVRISGADRYDTAVELAMHFSPTNKNMYGATGLDFPDAITGAVLAARNQTGVLLVREPLGDVVEEYVQNYRVRSVTLFGGKDAVSVAVADRLSRLIDGPPSVSPPATQPPTGKAGFRVRGGQLYGIDFASREVLLCPAPANLTTGDYVIDNDYNFYLIGSGDTRQLKGNFDYRQEVPYLLMPLNTRAPATVDAEFLNEAAHRLRANCPLATLGSSIMRAQDTWGVNAVYLLAHAALESAWGNSAIAKDKNNFYGFMAYDRDPYKNAATFETRDDCFLYVSAYIRRSYLNEGGSYFRGPTLDGMNRYYATDPMWAVKIAQMMQSIQPYSEESPYRKEPVQGVVDASALNLRHAPGTDAGVITSLSKGATVEIRGMRVLGGEYWFKVESSGGAGWVNGSYVTVQGQITGAVFFSNWFLPAEKTSLFLNVRPEPGKTREPVGKLYFGEKVTIYDLRMGEPSVWYRISSSEERWISGDFVIVDW